MIYSYPRLYNFVDSFFSCFSSDKARKKILKKIKNEKILEIGIGTGKSANYIDLKTNSFFGVDISYPMLKGIKNPSIKRKTVIADAKFLPFKDKSFSLSLFIFTLCVVENPIEVIKEALRVSKKVIILEYNTPSWIPISIWNVLEKIGRLLYNSKSIDLSLLSKVFKLARTFMMGGLFQVIEITSSD